MLKKIFAFRFFFAALFIFCILSFYLNFNISADESLKKSIVTNFSIKELKEISSIEITAQIANCLNNAKMTAIIKNKKKGIIKKIFSKNVIIDDRIELERIYYDPENFEAVYSGIIPYNLKEVDINLEFSNFPAGDSLERKFQPVIIAAAPVVEKILPQPAVPLKIKPQISEDTELLNRMSEEKRSNEANEELGRSIMYSAQKKQEAAKLQEQNDYETVVGVVILLPLLLEFAAGFGQENDFEIETGDLKESETEPNSESESEEKDDEESEEEEKKKNKKKNT